MSRLEDQIGEHERRIAEASSQAVRDAERARVRELEGELRQAEQGVHDLDQSVDGRVSAATLELVRVGLAGALGQPEGEGRAGLASVQQQLLVALEVAVDEVAQACAHALQTQQRGRRCVMEHQPQRPIGQLDERHLEFWVRRAEQRQRPRLQRLEHRVEAADLDGHLVRYGSEADGDGK